MPKPMLEPIELATLDAVTGGSRGYSTDLANQLSQIADSVNCLQQKTGGWGSSQFLLFAALAMSQRNQNNGVVYIGGPRFWW